MKNRSYFVLFLLGCTCFSGCGKAPSDRVEISETSTRSEYRFPVRLGATSQERFAVDTGASSPHGANASAQTASAEPFHFTAPPGWQELAPTQFRAVNLRLGPNMEAECTVSMTGGGVFANANRWRGQMGLSPLSEELFSMLPRRPVLGGEAIYLEFDGTYAGMGQGEAKEDYRLMGLLLERGGSNDVYVKLVGPAAVLRGERDNFNAFVDSLHDPAGHAHDAPAAGNVAATPPTSPATPAQSPNEPGMAWVVPEGWAPSPSASSMRLVTLVPEGSTSTECYVTVLRASDTLMNYNRWLGQMGQPAIDAEAMAALDSVDVLGAPVPVLSARGTYTGMGGGAKADYMLLGVARELGSESIFIKMIGPSAEVEANRDAFTAFCESLIVN